MMRAKNSLFLIFLFILLSVPLLSQTIDFSFRINEKNDSPLHFSVLNMRCNNYIMASILLNSENDSTITISCLTEEGLQSHTIILQESLCNKEQKFHLEHYDKSDSCSLEIFSQKIVFYNVHILPNSTIFDLFPNATNVSIGYSSISNYPKKRDNNIESIIALSLIIFDVLLLVFLHIRKRRKNFRNNESIIHTIVHEERYLGNAKRKSSVYLFGNFKVISKDGEDITRMFSPIIRELFLLIVCNTPKGGISAKKMDELLWFDKGHKSASNNRAVSISKLRNLIAKIGEGQIVAKNGNFVYEPVNVYIDYLVFAKIVASKNFDKGSIAECGTHESLSEARGVYYQLVRNQLEL